MADYSKKRFLVIDDQPLARDALRSVAQTLGAFAVEFSTNYQDAIYRIRQNAPDIILCDYVLGDGRSGQQLLEELRRFKLLPDETIFMMVTGEQSYEQVVAAVELVPDDYIIKPFSPDKLLLRLDRIMEKKNFFADYYREKRRQEYAAALAVLHACRNSEAGRPYRYEILRQQAEVELASGQVEQAEATYRGILENFNFPWARAGVARSLQQQNRLSEARQEIDQVVAATPHYFDAADVKASICMAQGEHGEAQKVLDAASQKTPRNYQRKRLLAEAANLNGDTATASAALSDVLANDSMPGAVTPADRLALARTHVAANELIGAEKVLLSLREGEVQNMALSEQASYAALLAVSLPGKGKPRFNGLRPALLVGELETAARIDVMRTALVLGDNELADHQCGQVMAGNETKKLFGTLRGLYSRHGREMDFREIQRQAALKRIHHETPAAG